MLITYQFLIATLHACLVYNMNDEADLGDVTSVRCNMKTSVRATCRSWKTTRIIAHFAFAFDGMSTSLHTYARPHVALFGRMHSFVQSFLPAFWPLDPTWSNLRSLPDMRAFPIWNNICLGLLLLGFSYIHLDWFHLVLCASCLSVGSRFLFLWSDWRQYACSRLTRLSSSSRGYVGLKLICAWLNDVMRVRITSFDHPSLRGLFFKVTTGVIFGLKL